MSQEQEQFDEPKTKEEDTFEEKRDAKGRRITKKRLESMKKNLANANKSRLAKKHAQNSIQEYEIESESDESSDSSSDSDSDDELLEAVMKKKKKETHLKESSKKNKPVPSKDIIADPRLDRLEAIVANLAQNVKKSHKKMKKANKGSKSEKIVLVQPNNRQAIPEKKTGKQGTDLLVEMLKNNVMF